MKGQERLVSSAGQGENDPKSLVVHSIDNGGSKRPVSHRSDDENEAKNPMNAAEEPANIGSHTYPFRGCH